MPFTHYHENPDNPIRQKFLDNPRVTFASSFIYFHRHGVAQNILYALKYKGNYEIGVAMGKWYGESLIDCLSEYDCVVPVPIHRKKEKLRGYNQSLAIAEGLSSVLNIPVRDKWLTRIRPTETQTRKSKTERWLNVEGIFNVRDKSTIEGVSCLVVDDVITTGATIGSLCEYMAKNGSGKIGVLSIATGAK